MIRLVLPGDEHTLQVTAVLLAMAIGLGPPWMKALLIPPDEVLPLLESQQ